MSKIIIRQGGIDDIDSILELFKKEIPQYWNKKPKDFWIWINQKLSYKNSIISLAECDDKIIGYYCIVPKLLKIGGELIEAGMGIHAVIDSDYKKKVSIMDVTNLAYEIAKKSNIKIIYGFPNDNYYLIQEKLERWDKVDRYKSIETKILNKFNTQYKLVNIRDFFNQFVNLDTSLNELVSIEKHILYYLERYINHPHSHYESFFVIDNDTWGGDKKTVGFLVTKIYNSEKGHIIDFILNDDNDIGDIIKLSNNYFYDNNIKNLSVWPTSVKFKKYIYDIYDNCKDGFNTNFYVKFLDESFKTKYRDKVTNINNWSLPMGESDAF